MEGCRSRPVIRCTSGSFGSNSIGSPGLGDASTVGLLRFGSSPALMALAIRRAWYFAYFIFEEISGLGGPHIWLRSRKVAAA